VLLLVDETKERGSSVTERELLLHLVHMGVLVAMLVFVRLQGNNEMGDDHHTKASGRVVAVSMVAVGS
jgi:hypothetical protein